MGDAVEGIVFDSETRKRDATSSGATTVAATSPRRGQAGFGAFLDQPTLEPGPFVKWLDQPDHGVVAVEDFATVGELGRPRLVLPNCSHPLLCRTPVDVFSRYLPSVAVTLDVLNSASLCRCCSRQSHGATGFGSTHNPRRSRLAAISASASWSSSEYRL